MKNLLDHPGQPLSLSLSLPSQKICWLPVFNVGHAGLAKSGLSVIAWAGCPRY